jgi:riboflavin synthase
MMFTGIVEEVGRVRAVTPTEGGMRLEITASAVLDDAVTGCSIAVNGCCLTLVDRSDDWWAADVQIESMHRTALGRLRAGDPVNLERPMRLGDRLGGHLVQGHVDTTGTIVAVEPESDGSARMRLDAPPDLLRYVVEKGSVTVDGVSLTVAAVDATGFDVALIPHTLTATTLGSSAVGTAVNLEPDVVAKYVESLLPTGRQAS